jgi:hypothetical protein
MIGQGELRVQHAKARAGADQGGDDVFDEVT